MYSPKIRTCLIILLLGGWGIVFIGYTLRPKTTPAPYLELKPDLSQPINEALELLKERRERDALVILDKILAAEPNNLDAIWARAEVFRRARQRKLSELMFKEILDKNPEYNRALLSLSFLKYEAGELKEARNLADRVFHGASTQRQEQALAYMMLGLIDLKSPYQGTVIGKINRGIKIKELFLKSVELAPELPETHLALGVFYLFRPRLEGGNLNNAVKELQLAVKIAPDFSEANAQLAQAYKKKGDTEKFEFYLNKAQGADPDNETLKKIKGEQGQDVRNN